MVRLKLKLNSKKPTTVYAVNGKTYTLSPGSNVLNLEYDDYISLTKALGIKPVNDDKKEEPQSTVAESNKVEESQDNSSVNNTQAENTDAVDSSEEDKNDNQTMSHDDSQADSSVEDAKVEDTKVEDKEDSTAIKNNDSEVLDDASSNREEPSSLSTEDEEADKEVDYSTWTLKQLKEKYKEFTGKTCRLKKDEVIAFLQENHA